MSDSAKPAIVLVHGAFADASGWRSVIALLQRNGYTVAAVQNSLFSLADDIATTKRVIEAQTAPVVLVAHSYGGAVITGAAADSQNVKALVFLAAFAPDANEPMGAFLEKYPTELGTALVPDSAGFAYIDQEKFLAVFCADLPAEDAAVMAICQKPIPLASFGATVPVPAWKTIPTWFLVSQQDHAINPELERFYAGRMGAHTEEIGASHAAFISHPAEIAAFIEKAAESLR
jgi:pimeloyl-ACP methyl ester carboxylesterase